MGVLNLEANSRSLHKRVPIPEGGELLVGRGRAAQLRLPGNTISRSHARFFGDAQGDWVDDAGSRNGVRVNGKQLQSAHRLQHGDRVEIGEFTLSYAVIAPSTDRNSADRETDVTPELTPTDISDIPESVPSPFASGRDGDSARRKTPAAAADALVSRKDVSAAGSLALMPTRTPEELRSTPRWSNVRQVGRGGMGEVYYALDHDLGLEVAIKRLRWRQDQGQLDLLRTLHDREAAIGRSLNHPNVVRVLEDGMHQGLPYLLMEWVEGTSLDRWRDRLNLTDKLELLRQIALGLSAAHAGGVVHADLKPANVMVVEATDSAGHTNLSILEDDDAFVDDTETGAIEEDVLREIQSRTHPIDFDALPGIRRDGELQLLVHEAERVAREGGFHWVLLQGPRGVGKSHLVRDLLHAQQHDPTLAQLEIVVYEDIESPAADAEGLYVSLLPEEFPDEPRIRSAYDFRIKRQQVSELFLQPVLRGQVIRWVESIVKHAPSARAFVDAVEKESGGLPARLLDALRRSFDEGAWLPSGAGYRFKLEAFRPNPTAVARLQY